MILVVISSCDIYNLCLFFKDAMIFYISTVIIKKEVTQDIKNLGKSYENVPFFKKLKYNFVKNEVLKY